MSSGRCWGAVIIIILDSINPGGRRFDDTVTLWLKIASYNLISDMVVDSAPGTVITNRLLLVIDCLTLDNTLGETSSMVMLSKLLGMLDTSDTVITNGLLLVIDYLTLNTMLREASSMVMLSKLLGRLGPGQGNTRCRLMVCRLGPR